MTVKPRPGRPRDNAADEAVLQATIERLAREGYHRMSIDDVARDAGVSRPTVYRRWPSKEKLVIAAVAKSVRTTRQKKTGDVREDLLQQARSLHTYQSADKYVGLLGTALVEREHHREIYDHLLNELIRPRREQIRSILMDGIKQGSIDKNIDVDVIVAMFVGSFYAITFAEDWNKLEEWPERLTDKIMALIEPPQESVTSTE